MRIAVIGASGFIGSAVTSHGRSMACDVTPIGGLRTRSAGGIVNESAVAQWIADHREEFDRLAASLDGIDVVVNAAGLARPESDDLSELRSANTLFPAVVANACQTAGVRRFVHVSSAAVQGRMNPLDETATSESFSPYSLSKAEAETLLLSGSAGPLPDEVVVYRPTSVHGVGRRITSQYARLARRRLVPIAGTGGAPLPVALIENVAAGIVHMATHGEVRPIVLQPWEGLTAAALYGVFNATRSLLQVPQWSAKLVLRLLTTPARSRSDARVRRLELLLSGQRQEARALEDLGFDIPIGHDGWHQLADAALTEPLPTS